MCWIIYCFPITVGLVVFYKVLWKCCCNNGTRSVLVQVPARTRSDRWRNSQVRQVWRFCFILFEVELSVNKSFWKQNCLNYECFCLNQTWSELEIYNFISVCMVSHLFYLDRYFHIWHFDCYYFHTRTTTHLMELLFLMC